MPDLTEHTAWVCRSNLEWRVEVTGSKGDKYYVAWERIFDRRITDAEYGYTCECKAFEFHPTKPCKHIRQVEGQRCAWNSEMDPGMVPDGEPGAWRCPSCGGPVEGIRVAV